MPIATIQINALRAGTIGRKEIKSTHLWYDTRTKTMQKFVGGQLKFSYDTNTRENTVSVEPLYIQKKGISSDIWQIRQWFAENFDEKAMQLIEDEPTHLIFSFKYKEDNELEELKDSLYSQRFDHDLIENAQGSYRRNA